jgi:hypothetical protein
MKFTTLPTDGRVIAGTWYPSTWPMWLARHDNLPPKTLLPHLDRILVRPAVTYRFRSSPGGALAGKVAFLSSGRDKVAGK